MRCRVRYRCGHSGVVYLNGTMERIYRKMDLLERMRCPDCLGAENSKLVTMQYSEYQTYYPMCRIKENSYDREGRTIQVYVPEDYEKNGSSSIDVRAEELRAAAALIRESRALTKEETTALSAAEQFILGYLRKTPIGSAYTAVCNAWLSGPELDHPCGNDPVNIVFHWMMDALK